MVGSLLQLLQAFGGQQRPQVQSSSGYSGMSSYDDIVQGEKSRAAQLNQLPGAQDIPGPGRERTALKTSPNGDAGETYRALVANAGPGAALSQLLSQQMGFLSRPGGGGSGYDPFKISTDLLMRQAGIGLQPMSQFQSRAGGGGGMGRPSSGSMRPAFDYQDMADQQFMRKDAMQGIRDNAMLRDLQVRGQAIQQNGMMDQQARANDAFARLMDLLPMVVRRAF